MIASCKHLQKKKHTYFSSNTSTFNPPSQILGGVKNLIKFSNCFKNLLSRSFANFVHLLSLGPQTSTTCLLGGGRSKYFPLTKTVDSLSLRESSAMDNVVHRTRGRGKVKEGEYSAAFRKECSIFFFYFFSIASKRVTGKTKRISSTLFKSTKIELELICS